jgi:hypothetical protein
MVHRTSCRLAAGAILLALVGLGCSDEKVVFREPVNPPPDANSGFLGYFTAKDKQTTCGNCHIGHQRAWVNTAHAGAYETLATSGAAQPFCYSCHTVSDKGNATAEPAGWDAVPDSAYHDVQCESCHGPGNTHVQEPDAPASANNPPLAHVGVLGDSATLATSCAGCHNGVHHPFVDEWSQSAHARSLEESPGVFVADNPSCASCHEGKAVLAAWGVTSNYAERGQTGSSHYLGMTCAVCHDPHGSAKGADGKPLQGQLRFPIDVADPNQNLCMKCHQRRPQPDQASSRGPHSPQGPMLLGDAGYKPAGFDPDIQAVASTHGSDKNPRLCAGCHVNQYIVTDQATGAFQARSVGHLFLPIPCTAANGAPTPDRTCAYDAPSRSWAACTNSGCHADATQAASLFNLSSQRLDQLTKQIWDDKNANDAVDPAPVDGGYLSDQTSVPATEYQTGDNKITPAEGAVFNVRMLRPGPRGLGGGVDGSSGVHNPFLAEALLRGDISELQATYPGLPQATVGVQEIMKGPLGAVTKRPLLRPLISRPISSR